MIRHTKKSLRADHKLRIAARKARRNKPDRRIVGPIADRLTIKQIDRPRWYMPHQGKREMARRRLQIVKAGFKRLDASRGA
jgi:hypothetical protein